MQITDLTRMSTATWPLRHVAILANHR